MIKKYYSQFVIEEKYGFNKMTKKLFVEDEIKGFIIANLLQFVLGLLIHYSMDYFEESFLFYTWIIIIVILVIFLLLYPTVIMPWFNKFESLDINNEKEKKVYDRINVLTNELKFPM